MTAFSTSSAGVANAAGGIPHDPTESLQADNARPAQHDFEAASIPAIPPNALIQRGKRTYARLLTSKNTDSGGSPLMKHVRHATATIATAAALTMTLAGCGGDEPDPIPSTSPSTSASAPSPSPSTDPDAWKKKYNAKQVAAFDAALQRWDDYESRSEPIWAKGKATPAAQDLFKDYFSSSGAMIQFNRLKTYQQVEVTVSGTPEVYWSRAKEITKPATSVTIEQCLDYTPVETTQRGEAVDRPAPTPQLRTIHMSKPAGYDWLIYDLVELDKNGKGRPCTP